MSRQGAGVAVGCGVAEAEGVGDAWGAPANGVAVAKGSFAGVGVTE